MSRFLLMLLTLVCLAVLPLAWAGHDCMHDSIMEKVGHLTNATANQQYVIDFEVETSSHRRLSTFAPMRIRLDIAKLAPGVDVDGAGNPLMCAPGDAGQSIKLTDGTIHTCTKNDELTLSKKSFLISTILFQAKEWYQGVLGVQPVVGNLAISQGWGCGSSGLYACCDNQINPDYKTNGVPNADFLIVVTARPTTGSTIAWALTCQSDQYSRPTFGHANFGPALIDESSRARNQQLGTALHELAHALGFSSSKFTSFREPGNGAPWGASNVKRTYTERGSASGAINKLVTPTIVAKVKEHFDCFDWADAGGELEDFGGSGTAGSHWEKRVFEGEFMTGISSRNPVYSSLTFALFQDTGWYSVDFSRAQTLPWGNKEGCDFIKRKCSESWTSKYFCITESQPGCTADYMTRGYCNAKTYPSNIASQYQYYADPKVGGNDPYMDYCTLYAGYSNGDCRDMGTSPSFVQPQYGEALGASSRCFMGTHNNGAATLSQHYACHPVDCAPDGLSYKLQVAGTWVNCPPGGGTAGMSGVVSGFRGQVTCPPVTAMCTASQSYCPLACSNQGTCQSDGSCVCNPGRTGPGCQYAQCPAGTSAGVCDVLTNSNCCSGHGTCDSTSGQCTCSSGYHLNDCSAMLCPAGGKTNGQDVCSGHGTCDAVTGACTCDTGYSGTDCASVPGCSQQPTPLCSGQGTCDNLVGACVCATGYGGVSCNISPYAINATLVGAVDTNITDSVPYKEYKFYALWVADAVYDITVTLYNLTASSDADLYVSYDTTNGATKDPASPPTSVSNTWSSSTNGGIEIVHLCGSYGTFPRGSGKTMCDSADWSFTGAGWLYIGVMGYSVAPFTLAVSRDACASLACVNGVCNGGKCNCDPRWSGVQCDAPDCPGTPDCSGKGTCSLNVAGYVGTPTCQCSPAWWTGVDCATLDPSIAVVSMNFTAAAGAAAAPVTKTQSLTRGASVVFHELQVTSLDVALSVEVVSANFDATSNENPDVMLFMRRGQIPSNDLSQFDAFDSRSWFAGGSGASIVLDSSNGLRTGSWFIRVVNSQYARKSLQFSITVGAVATGSCPPAANNCNGGGTCQVSGNPLISTCTCVAGRGGEFCQDRITSLTSNSPWSSSSALLPGSWAYFSVTVSGAQLTVNLQQTGPAVGNPLVLLRAEKLPRLDKPSLFDYNAMSNGTRAHTMVLRAPELKSGQYFIAVGNPVTATVPISYTLTASVAPAASYGGNCGSAVCNGRGKCLGSVNSSSYTCLCDSGWSGETCNTPRLRAVTQLQSASQSITSLCNLCTVTRTLAAGDFVIFRVPQPLGNSALTVSVTCALGSCNSSNPDIYISETLPRSVYDFTQAVASDGTTEEVFLNKTSPTGRYWVAVYANGPADYVISASRQRLSAGPKLLTDSNFAAAVWQWIASTTMGKATFVISIAVLGCLFAGCCCQCATQRNLMKRYKHGGQTRPVSGGAPKPRAAAAAAPAGRTGRATSHAPAAGVRAATPVRPASAAFPRATVQLSPVFQNNNARPGARQ